MNIWRFAAYSVL